MFNAIADGAAKVDFIVRRERPFSVEEFARRQPADLLGTPGFIVSVEDLVAVDRAYVERWVACLDLGEIWDRVKADS